jgi:hypothetical protein
MTKEQFDAMRDFLRARVGELSATQMLVDVEFMRQLLGVPEPAPAMSQPVVDSTPVEVVADADPVAEAAELPPNPPAKRRR